MRVVRNKIRKATHPVIWRVTKPRRILILGGMAEDGACERDESCRHKHVACFHALFERLHEERQVDTTQCYKKMSTYNTVSVLLPSSVLNHRSPNRSPMGVVMATIASTHQRMTPSHGVPTCVGQYMGTSQ